MKSSTQTIVIGIVCFVFLAWLLWGGKQNPVKNWFNAARPIPTLKSCMAGCKMKPSDCKSYCQGVVIPKSGAAPIKK